GRENRAERSCNFISFAARADPIIDSMSARTPAKKPRLLLVDDDPLIAESLTFALESDYEVARGHDRESAVALLRDGLKPDLALIDLGLPPVAHLPNAGFQLTGDLLAHVPG